MITTKQTVAVSIFTIATFLVVGVVFWATMAQAAKAPERVIVTFEHAVNKDVFKVLENRGAQILKDLELINGVVVLVPEAAIPGLSAVAGVKAVEKDVRAYTQKPPGGCDPWPGCKDNGGDDSSDTSTQPAETLEWGVDRIDADLAWGTSRGTGIKVAVIDTGIDKDHKDLLLNIKGGVNFVAPKSGPPRNRVANPDAWNDDNGHGTHVAGIIAAVDNEIGIIGTAPEAHLYGVKVLDSSGSGYLSDVVDGIGWAVANGMNIINLSLGCDCDTTALKDAVDNAYKAGLVLVAAAGNSGDGDGSTNDVIYPAKYASVIAVSATDINDGTPIWSSEGEEVEVAAPGVSIRSTWNDGLYKTISGTSMASPHAAGTVALMLGSGITPADIRTTLYTTADDLGDVGFDNFYGYGLVDAEETTTGSQTN